MPSVIADLEQAGGGTPRALSPLLVIYSTEVALKGLHKSWCLSFEDLKKLKQPKQDIREDGVLWPRPALWAFGLTLIAASTFKMYWNNERSYACPVLPTQPRHSNNALKI